MQADNSTNTAFYSALPTQGRVLLLANQLPATAQNFDQLVHVDAESLMLQNAHQQLPFAKQSFDAVAIDMTLCFCNSADAESILQEASRVLRKGGTLLLQEILLPNHKKSERYVDALERLRHPDYRLASPLYRWKNMLASVQLSVMEWEQQGARVPLFATGHRLTAIEQQRLQVMLARAPQRVHDWLHPQDTETRLAHYDQQRILLRGRRDE